MLKYIITKIINQAIILSFYVGILLAFLFWDKTYLWICVPQVLYFIGTLYDVPVLSYFIRMFNWPLVKILFIKNLRGGENIRPETINLIMHLEHSDIPKKIYINKGNKYFIEYIEKFSVENSRDTEALFGKFDNIKNKLNQSLEEGLSQEECIIQISDQFKEILPNINPELNQRLSSLFVEMEQDKKNLQQKREEGVSEEELQKISFEKMIESLKKIKNSKNGSEQSK